jgi:hypothetical protein
MFRAYVCYMTKLSGSRLYSIETVGLFISYGINGIENKSIATCSNYCSEM